MSTTEVILAVCFWCSVLGVAYTYLLYPILLFTLSRLFGAEPHPPEEDEGNLRQAALLIAAHNEADVIEGRIQNALATRYPPERFSIIIASDGSDDATVSIARQYEPQIRVLANPQRQGKAATLNALVPQLEADIVVLSDANTMMDPMAVRRLVRWFADPSVGAVCGRLELVDVVSGRNVDGLYWRFETFLKKCEGRLNGLLGANGAIYAIRRDLFSPLPPGSMIDDFMIPLQARLRTGCRLVYDPTATACEETAPDIKGEFRRRSRIGAGGFQALITLWPLLNPRQGWTAFTFWSHKVMRWICPMLLVAALVSAAGLAVHPAYRAALCAQLLFYGLSAAISLLPTAKALRPLRIAPMFVSMNIALLVGFWKGVQGRQTGVWNRTARLQTQGSLRA